ncbi:glycoside hydrolase superfamily, partial [Dichomitus squalens]
MRGGNRREGSDNPHGSGVGSKRSGFVLTQEPARACPWDCTIATPSAGKMSNQTTEQVAPAIDIFPSSPIAPVSPYIFSGFLEHLGSCIYGGILPSTRTAFPYTPRKPFPEAQFTETPAALLTPKRFRADVLEVLRDELRVPLIRWPGGNFAIRMLKLSTSRFIAWCRAAKIEPYIILNMGTGTLENALHWIDYYANLRRKNTGRDEAYGVKYRGLGNEVWGEWQVGQQTASAYATKARQWAHAIRLVDPNVILVGCGEIGIDPWDGVVLDELADKVDLHSIHLYTGFGPRDRSRTERHYGRSVYGPDAAEYSIEVCKGLINKACSPRRFPSLRIVVRRCFERSASTLLAAASPRIAQAQVVKVRVLEQLQEGAQCRASGPSR